MKTLLFPKIMIWNPNIDLFDSSLSLAGPGIISYRFSLPDRLWRTLWFIPHKRFLLLLWRFSCGCGHSPFIIGRQRRYLYRSGSAICCSSKSWSSDEAALGATRPTGSSSLSVTAIGSVSRLSFQFRLDRSAVFSVLLLASPKTINYKRHRWRAKNETNH